MADVLNIVTEDDLKYQFYPVSSGSVQFKVKAANDAHLALTVGPREADPKYEIIIGGWGNTKSVIRKNKTTSVKVDTPNILNGRDFRSFWLRWDGGVISAGHEGESKHFITWTDPEPFSVGYVGVCTGWGATGTWKIDQGDEFDTPDSLEYRFVPVAAGSLEFEYRGPHNCHVCLTSEPAEVDPMYEIILGGWENSKSVIRYSRQKPDKVTVPTPGLMNANEFKKILIQWVSGRLLVRDGSTGDLLMEWVDPSPILITHFGVRTGYGARGNWRIIHYNKTAAALKQAPSPTLVWVDAKEGKVPQGAVVGGQDSSGEPLYVARAQHEGALVPGKLVRSHGRAYVPWNGKEHGKPEYQVLVGGTNKWVPTNGSNIPSGAFPGGENKDGEPLFIGRVKHEGSVITGKVQQSHGVCYIPFGGKEHGFPDYEILMR